MNPANGRDAGAHTDLILFVTGDSPRSLRARANLDKAMEALPDAGITVRRIDLLQDTEGISEYGIFATPALIRIRETGEPAVLYGDLSNATELQRFLDAAGDRAIA